MTTFEDELWVQIREQMGAGKTLSEAEKQLALERPLDVRAWMLEEIRKMYYEELKKELRILLGVDDGQDAQA